MKEKSSRQSAGNPPEPRAVSASGGSLAPESELNWKAIAVCAAVILVFAVFIRFVHLEKMAYHHDESIHAYYSYKLYDMGRSQYSYSPVYHGPLQYHYIALMFLLFGDSNYTGRMAHAFSGVLLIALLYLLRKHVNPMTVLLAMLFVAISPTVTYFSRFARNDILMACWNMITLICGYLYLKEKRPWQFILCWAGVMLCYCTKESSYVPNGLFGLFVVLYAGWLILFPSVPDSPRKPLFGNRGGFRYTLYLFFVEYRLFTCMLAIFGLWSFFQFVYAWIPMHSIDYSTIGGDFSLPLVRTEWAKYLQANPFYTGLWWGSFAVVLAVTLFFIGFFNRIFRDEAERLAATGDRKALFEKDENPDLGLLGPVLNNYLLVVTVLLMASIYVFFFSTMGANKQGLHDGLIEYLTYWLGQQNKPRIGGDAWYHIWRLVVYEPGMVLLAILGTVWFLARVLLAFLFPPVSETGESFTWKDHLPSPFYALMVFWTWATVAVYAHLQEKVPWLMTHQALPLCLLSAFFVGDLLRRLSFRPAKLAVLLVVGIISVWAVRTNILLNMYNNDDPREAIVYTQSTQDVLLVMDEIDQMARETGLREKLRVSVGGGSEGVDWPYWWYLRHYSPQVSNWDPRIPVMITGYSQKAMVDRAVGDEGVWRSFRGRLRAWWLPDKIFQKEGWFPKFWRYFVHREPWSQLGSSDFQVYIRQDPPNINWIPPLGTATMAAVQTPEATLNVAKAVSGTQLASFGTAGSGPGQFKDPRALEIGPDGLLYVTDSGNGRIEVFGQDGTFQLAIGRAMRGPNDVQGLQTQYGGPCGVGVGPNGDVYVADTWNHRIVHYSSVGAYLGEFRIPASSGAGGFFGPRDVAVAPDGNLYISDTGNARIVVLDPQGKFLRTFGARGKGLGYLNEPVGLAIHGDRVYVADTGNQQIKIFNLKGEALAAWPVEGWEPLEYMDPETRETTKLISVIEPYIAVDSLGNVYITEKNENLVHQYSPDGKSVRKWGLGRGMNHPTGIAVGADGVVFVADKNNNRILKFRRLE